MTEKKKKQSDEIDVGWIMHNLGHVDTYIGVNEVNLACIRDWIREVKVELKKKE